jgi:hypothetical protein
MNEDELRAWMGDFEYEEMKRKEAVVVPDPTPPARWVNPERDYEPKA